MKLIEIIGTRAPDLGYMSVVVDGGAAVYVDCYAATEATGVTLFEAFASDAAHTVDVEAMAHANPASSSTGIEIDSVTATTIEDAMGTLSSYLRTALVDHARGVTTYSRAATVYIALFNGGTEVSGNNYSRTAITNNATNFPAAASREKSLAGSHSSATASGTWTFDEVRIYDHVSAGNMMASHTLGSPATVLDGQAYIIDGASGSELTLTMPAGGMVDAVAEALLDHAFGGGDYTAEAATHGTYFDGDPQAAGSELSATRVSITNDGTEWAAASAGLTSNINAITLAAEAGATHWAEYDAGAAGNLLWSTALPEEPTAGEIQAGRLRFQLIDA